MSNASDSTVAARRGWLKGLGALLTGGLLLGHRRAAAEPPTEALAPNGPIIFMGEIMMLACDFAPKGFALCNGQLLPINQNQGLFALLGTTYGGDGRQNFALPDLRGRIPLCDDDGGSYPLGQLAGAESHVLSATEMPPHMHGYQVSADRGTTELAGVAGVGGSSLTSHYLADSGSGAPQFGSVPNATLNTGQGGKGALNMSSNVGSNEAHSNMQPYTCINFVIATQGIFPSPF